MTSWLRSWLKTITRRMQRAARRSAQRDGRRLHIDLLEDRLTPAAPILTVGPTTIAYAEDTDPSGPTFSSDFRQVIDPALTLTDADGDNITSASVAIFSGFQAGADVLSVDVILANSLGINTAFVGGTLSLSGSTSAANYASVLRTVAYSNTSETPSTATRTIDFSAVDATAAASNTDSVSVTVGATNDAPVNTVPAATQTIFEDTTLVFSTANGNEITVADVDAAGADVEVSLQVARGTLALGGTAGLTSVLGNGTAAVTFRGSLVNVNAALEGLAFTPNPSFSGSDTLVVTTSDLGNTGAPGTRLDADAVSLFVVNVDNDTPTAPDRTFTLPEDTALSGALTASDPEGAPLTYAVHTPPASGSLNLAPDGSFTYTPVANFFGSITFKYTASDGANTSAPATVTINFTAVPDAPVANNDVKTVAEDSGANVVDVFANDTDPDNLSPPLSAGLTITSVTQGEHGTVTITGGGTGLTYTPALDYFGSDLFSYTLSDGTFSRTAFVDVTVTSVNDAPGGADKTVTVNEDASYTFTAADFGFTDASDTPANGFLAVKFSAIAPIDLLTNDGIAVAPGDFVSKADIDAGKLKFTPTPHTNGAAYATLSFQVQDGGGAHNGGADLDPIANTLSVDVTSINDAPAGADKTVTTDEDTTYVFTVADFGLTDIDDSPANALLAVRVTTLPAAGSLTNNGVPVSAGASVPVADITGGKFQFAPPANAKGTPFASFTFQVQDDGGIQNGGVDFDSTPNLLTINVTSVNDPPAGANKTITTLEDTAFTFSAADFGFTDPLDSPANRLLAVRITTLPLTGTLTNDNVAVVAGGFVTKVDIDAGKLKFTPAFDANGAANASFTFQVQDNGGGTDLDTVADTITVNVTSVNDAPGGADKTVTTPEDTAYTFLAADFGFNEANDNPANTFLAVRITTLPATGALTNNNVAVVAGDFISKADIDAARLKFTPALDASGAANASFTFQVQDNGGTLNGGLDLDPTPNTITVDVTAGNDAPVITSAATASVQENTTTVQTVTATDADGTITEYSISGGPDAARFAINAGTGALSFVTAPDFEAPADIGANNVYDVIVQAKDNSGATTTKAVAVTVTDQAGETNGSVSGRVFVDADRDGVADASETAAFGSSPYIAGRIVFLDANQNGTLDAGETSTVTDAQGNYAFTGLTPGQSVRVTLASSPAYAIVGPAFAQVALATTATDRTFSLVPSAPVGPFFLTGANPEDGDNDTSYVLSLYATLLGQDARGLAAVSAQVDSLKNGGRRTVVVNAILQGAPYRTRVLQSYYLNYLDRAPTGAELRRHLTSLRQGASLESIALGILRSRAYLNRFGTADFITRVYEDILGRRPSAAEQAGVTQFLRTGRRLAIVNFLFRSTEAHNLAIDAQYVTLLGRNPSDGERQFVLGQLSRGRLTVAGLQRAILAGDEYRARFGV